MRDGTLGGGLVILVVGGDDGFQVFGLEHLVAIQASHIVHTVTSRQYFRAVVIAGLHRIREIIPILSMSDRLSSPQKCLFDPYLRSFFDPTRGIRLSERVVVATCLKQSNAKMFVVLADLDQVRVERFKESTKAKLRGLRCPEHHQPPRLHFQGISLRDITISMSGCCPKLMELANARIASALIMEAEIRKPA
jgi:hypothetical protein